jgi:diacylglycerol kinase family enzyme
MVRAVGGSEARAARSDAGRTRVGRGAGVAALFNGRAKAVSPAVVRLFARALPEARVLVSEDFDQAERHAQTLAQERHRVIFSGGGDGAAQRLLNMLRRYLPEDEPFPPVGVLRLGTGNAWARTVGAPSYPGIVARLPALPWPLPTRRFDLVEVEDTLCPFAGVGWDARILNDYQRNLDRRSGQLFGSRLSTRLHKGLVGYLYAMTRHTIPGLVAAASEQPWATLRRAGGEVFKVDEAGEPRPYPHEVLYEGPVSVAAAATCPEYGFGFRAFPFADRIPGHLHLRVYDRPVLEAVGNMGRLWAGVHPQPGMHDFLVPAAKLTFTRPLPFQIGGDARGERTGLDVRVADRSVQVVDWAAAMARP